MDVAKLHALGNDFLVCERSLDRLAADDFGPLAVAVCDRHRGLGADGLMVVAAIDDREGGRFRTRIFNSDGSEAEMSGNGVRCAAAYLYHFGGLRRDDVTFETSAGVKRLRFLECSDTTYRFETNMGRPILKSEMIPMAGEPTDRVVRRPLSLGGAWHEITAVSMGNPHCVILLQQWDEFDQDYLGFNLSNHPVFPNRVNVEFVQVLSRKEIRVGFWERGVGPTMASGTGSCAAAVAGVLNDWTDESVTVLTRAGRLQVDWRNREEVFLTGPAEVVFRGEFFHPVQSSCQLP